MTMLPFVALMSVPKSRRRRLLPVALPGVAGLPPAAAGAMAVITADSVSAGERAAATADATSAVTEVLTAAVAHGAELEVEDLQHVPLAHHVVTSNPGILRPAASGLSAEQARALQNRVTKLERALASLEESGTASGTARSTSRPRRTTRSTANRSAPASAPDGDGGDGG